MNDRMPPLHVGHGTTVGALTVFPVWVDAPVVHGLAWSGTALEVGERAGSPVVGELVAHNKSTRPLVVLEGDIVSGGWQDRMVADSLVMAPRERRVLDALCVEQGRWSGTTEHRPDGRRGSPAVRHRNVTAADGLAQSEVWNGIARYEHRLGSSATAALTTHLDRNADEARQLPRPLDGQRGVMIGIGGRILGIELFGNARGLAHRWNGIIEAALLDAQLAPRRATPAESARAFARALAGMSLDVGDAAGVARRVSSASGALHGSGMMLDGTDLVQLSVMDRAHPVLEVAA